MLSGASPYPLSGLMTEGVSPKFKSRILPEEGVDAGPFSEAIAATRYEKL